MPGPAIPFSPPKWADPKQASVFDSVWTRALRMIGRAIGANDPQSQVMGIAAPLEQPNAEASAGMRFLEEKFPKVAQYIKAYHGSPHDFEQFSAEKIGTGEGAQAYGHGLYFAENPEVAQDYQKRLAGWNSPARYYVKGVETPDDLSRYVASSVYEHGKADSVKFFKQTAKQELANGGQLTPDHEPGWFQRAADLASTLSKSDVEKRQGHVYEVAIKAHPDQFLDWDKPLKDQAPNVKAAANDWLKQRGISIVPTGPTLSDVKVGSETIGAFPHAKAAEVAANPADYVPLTGKNFYQALEMDRAADRGAWKNPSEFASQELHQIYEIPGIKYLDQGSRPSGEGTSNYVVFDPKLIGIMKKYGIVATVAGGGAAAASQQPQGQQP